MNAELRAWLDRKVSELPEPQPRVIDRIAELITVNGGLRVRGWGVISSGGPYGRWGLDQEEALELLHYSGMFHGIELMDKPMSVEVHQEIREILNATAEKWKAQQEAEKPATSGLVSVP